MIIKSQIAVNLPNILTFLRFILTPLFLIFFCIYFFSAEKNFFGIFAIFLFIVICLTDILDGYMARKKGVASTFGMYFDVSADFFFRFSSFLLFCFLKIIPFALVVVYSIFFIEFILMSKINTAENIIPEISIFRKSAPILYMLFIGVVILKDFFPDSISGLINLSAISYALAIFTLLAITEILVFFSLRILRREILQ
ncbi:MAG: hypothetical protein A3C43_01130 [Candidatus Schekmanbacteria bacterium RIFCSPHIGHO2_02_FULL_38_11]|uniref:CDP-diacylglycerol--glycerol-3-phosphate 3-phosphatidyltransferase n=1 Tax=Candidatus Schekmanbacteria bacterium RIFCSPLOWO2_12_FULL_38_15 TaxID=1817883 RepID=A0A1F7SIB8_9BACT|nr:MAG: hypothetical protein A3C43_01130 [Candidatus Schekmanbacteria bacterium RIFCSPHIGHO2_02_FULL_38_11]OGL50731.1 MAG: hypothetical protein A3H37_02650 [Candidatus Schekmanbacteria bacterium RIFCSPLOWO2_02_FULL_38_14]OGL53509.1 MAG: hypothetical protein A3G31_08415 [Candidatus Schekmanbacteria bacterium RIFCSPLOWO2_12_FULL_38_15]